ncbi:siderophore-interacting protein [soil metagenome]
MHGVVEHVERLTPTIIRIVLGGDGLTDFTAGTYTDEYVNVAFAPAGAPYQMPCDLQAVKRDLPRDLQPHRRRYTVRRWDAAARLLTIDVVVHGSEGVGGSWASAAAPGDLLQFEGPGGGYAPDPDAAWHLMVGDESALPAIAASLERVPAGTPVHVLLEVGGPDEQLPLDTPGRLHLSWLHRQAHPEQGDLLAAAVRDLAFPTGHAQAFVHGEAAMVREVRRHLLRDRGIAREALSASPYWRRGMTDEAWRTVKKAWQDEVERDVG